VRPILEYGALCWNPYREGKINALDRVQKKAAKFANPTNDSVWSTLKQRRKMAHICASFKDYTGERAWKAVRDRLQGLCYLSRDYHDHNIWARKQRKDIGKCSFVNRTINLWNQLSVEALVTFPCISHFLERGLGKLEVKRFWSVVRKRPNVQGSEEWGVKNGEWSIVKRSEVK